MRVVIVHNSSAGEPQHSGDALVRLIRGAGHDPAYFPVNDDAWKGALDGFAEVVAVAGGDGTVEEVARAVAGRQLPIAVLPLGTANNISRALGQADIQIEELVAGWAGASRQPFDVGLARGPWGTFRFLESVGAGLLADGIAEIKAGGAGDVRRAGNAGDQMAAARRLFHRLLGSMAAMRFSLSLDGRDRSGEYVLIEALNFGAAGPNLRFVPRAEPSDGLLDVVLVDERHRRHLAQHLSSPMNPAGAGLPVYQTRHVRLSSERCNLHMDGNVWSGREAGEGPIVIDLSVEPKALTFLRLKPDPTTLVVQ